MREKKERQSRFPISTFWIVLGVLLLTAGVNAGMLIGMAEAGWAPIIQVHIVLLYWVAVSLLLTWLVRARMKVAYDKPMQTISAATKQVARGDFSVRVEPLHEPEKEDYLDLMIHDLNAMIGELGSIETLKTDFISSVSHEMKTPLAVISNYGSLLQSDKLTEDERKEYAAAVTESARRMSELITNILRLNRLENQQLSPMCRPFDLAAQLGECILQFEPVWEEKQIELEIDLPDELEISSDPELLSLVWNNLLSNAFKFTPAGGKVSVGLTADGGSAIVAVSDSGPGMSEETQKHIFDKFYQGDKSHAAQGNGLGLALVKRVLDLTGGEITVDSVEGVGSSFTVGLGRRADE